MAKTEPTPEPAIDQVIIASYSDTDVFDSQVAYILSDKENIDNGYYKDMSEAQIREDVYTDSDIYQFAWNDFKETATEAMKKCNPNDWEWKANGRNIGWRNRDGEKTFKADDFEALQKEIFPKTGDLSVICYDLGEGTGLRFVVSHHDAPMGETYDVYPLDEVDVEVSYDPMEVITMNRHLAIQLNKKEILIDSTYDVPYFEIDYDNFNKECLTTAIIESAVEGFEPAIKHLQMEVIQTAQTAYKQAVRECPKERPHIHFRLHVFSNGEVITDPQYDDFYPIEEAKQAVLAFVRQVKERCNARLYYEYEFAESDESLTGKEDAENAILSYGGL